MTKAELLYNANGTLAMLTKLRCSIDTSKHNFKDFKRITLLPWPLPFTKNPVLFNSLERYEVRKNEKVKAYGYGVPYEDYKGLKNIDKIDLTKLHHLRSCIVFYNLLHLPSSNIEVGYYWDQEKNHYKTYPQNTNEFSIIDNITDRRDAYYTFVDKSANVKFKALGFLGPIIFDQLTLFPNQKISIGDRRKIKGKKTDNDGRSFRIIIDHSQKDRLNEVINVTKRNILKILPKEPWINSVKKATLEYYGK